MAAANNLNEAQLELELINEARLNPMANAARYITSYAPLTSNNQEVQNNFNFWNVNGTTLQQAFSALHPVDPLAWNDTLAATALAHDNAEIAANQVDHVLAGEKGIFERISAAGYNGTNSTSVGENIEGQFHDAMAAHAGFMVDWGNPDPGHRNNIMGINSAANAHASEYREIGIGVVETPVQSNIGPYVVTEDLGGRGSSGVFILGVAYNDSDHNKFYSVGEGLGNLGVSLGGASANSSSAGGYTLATSLTGLQTLTYTGAGLSAPVSVTANFVDGHNYKIDVIDGHTLQTSVSATISGPISEVHGLGVTGLELTTGAGSQTFFGTTGNDTLNGGADADTAVYAGNSANYAVTHNADGSVTVAGAEGTDRLVSIESIQFADQTVPATPSAGAVSINDVMITEGNAGTQMATFTVARTGGSGAFDVNFATSDGSATVADGDYARNAGTLHFDANVNSQTVSVAIDGDTKVEGNESLGVLLSGATNGATISDSTGTATITNDDAAPVAGAVSIGDVMITEGDAGTQMATFTVARTGGSGAFDVNFATSDGSATVADGDYARNAGTLHFDENVNTQTVSVAINGDTKVEGNESLGVLLSGATNGATISHDTGTATIINDDDAAPVAGAVSIGDVIITEGDNGTQMATFTVARTGGSGAFDVNFATSDGTATVADGDYARNAGTLHFDENVNTQTVSVAINGDTKVEGNESLGVLLSGATNGATISHDTGTATIINDDAAAPVAGAVSIGDVMITEGDNGTQMATFTVARTGGSGAFDVNFATSDGTATVADGDYARNAGTLHFDENVNTQTVSVAINGDTKVEGNESLGVLLSGATNGATISHDTGTATIINDDAAAPVAGAVSIGDVMITEGDNGTQMATFTVARTGGSGAFDVNFATSDGTATVADGDYARNAGTLHFDENVNTQTVSVAINGDTKVEGNESLGVLLSGATNGTTISHDTGTATIINDDAAAPVAGAVSINDVMITEGDDGTQMATFTVARTGGNGAFDVNFATSDGSATVADGDYARNAGTLHFDANVNSQTVSVAIDGDTKVEGNETLNVLLSGATNGATISDDTGTATITNDDVAAATHAPVVTTHDVSVAADDAIAGSSLFVAHDQDGDNTISEYAFWDGGSAGGHFTMDGVTQASGQWIYVDASDLDSISYVGGSSADDETLYVSAYDGQAWSDTTASLTATTTATTTVSDSHAPADFDGDGNSDVLWRNDNGSVAMWQMDGTNVIANEGVGSAGNDWHIEGKADFNGDGNSDVLWRNDNGSVAMWEMEGNQIVANESVGSAGNDWHIEGQGDFNGDGNSDVLWRNDNGSVAMWEMEGNQIIANESVGSAGNDWQVAGVGDFNGDGNSDVLWRNDNGSVAMWEMEGAKIMANESVGSAGNDWHVAGVGDFNADAHSDVLWRNDNGSVAMWEMEGAKIVANESVGSAANDWHVADTGDYNGDQHADILWRSDTGAAAMWEMDGTHISTNQGIGSAVNEWHTY